MAQQDTQQKDHWSTEAYNTSASFVSQLTTRVLSLLDPQPTDVILDIGCGDGELTERISARCKSVLGLDSSRAFIETALSNERRAVNAYYDLQDCRRLDSNSGSEENDKVFSNAALHWILRDEASRKPFFHDVYIKLKPGGSFVFEMGGAGNVAEVHTALISVLHLSYKLPLSIIRGADPWFFASEQWMRTTLDETGFEDVLIETEYRPTKLDPSDGRGNGGLAGWVKLMGASFLDLLDDADRIKAVESVCDVVKPIVTREDGSEWLGYVRLRAVARKPSG